MNGSGGLKEWPNGSTAAWIRLVLNFLVVPVIAWLLHIDHQVTAIQANRFTAMDGAKIWERIAGLPPTDFQNKVDRLVVDVTELKIMMRDHQKKHP